MPKLATLSFNLQQQIQECHVNEPSRTEIGEPASGLFHDVSKEFAKALHSARSVAGDGQNEPTRLTQERLRMRAGVGRATVAKYEAARNSEGGVANPDLDTLCKLAAAFNLPPAFLLMRPSDWSRLAQAAAGTTAFLEDPKVRDLVRLMCKSKKGPADVADGALLLAQRLGVYNPIPPQETGPNPFQIPERWRLATEVEWNRARLGILSATAILPTNLGAADPETLERQMYELIYLYCICIAMGAATDTESRS